MTALDLITQAYWKSGVVAIGEPVEAPQATSGLADLNGMIDKWNVDPGMIFATPPIVFAGSPPAGTASDSGTYWTIGPGGNFSGDRPVKIERSNIIVAGARAPLEMLDKNQWSLIAAPNTAAVPPATATKMWYDEEFKLTAPTGTGKIYLSPVPAAAFKLEIFPWLKLSSFPSLTTVFLVPPAYYEAMLWNLAIRVSIGILTPTQEVIALATSSLQAIQQKNAPEWWSVPREVRRRMR